MKVNKGVFALFTALRCVGAEVITDGSRKQLRNLQVVSTPATASDFEMHSAGEGCICEPGYEVTEAECLDAANESGVGMTLRPSLVVYDWDWTPCGCFVNNDWHVNYKDPEHGNCLAQELSKLVCRSGSTTITQCDAENVVPSTSTFEMYSGGEGGGICESGYEVTQAQCLDAAHETGMGITLTTTVMASDWATTPCGCFIFNEEYVNYKDPVHGNCLDQEISRLVCLAGGTIFPTFDMYPAGEEGSSICASGFEITEELCLVAAHRTGGSTGVGMTLTTDLTVTTYAGLPCGCFVYNDSVVNYKDPANGNCAAQELSKLLCREGSKPFEMYSAGEGGGICESGYEVTQAQCLDAAHATGVGMTLTAEVMASNGATMPCGCFIFNEQYVNYKDPVHGNCVDQEISRLVCLAGGTVFPTFEMYPAGDISGICASGFEVTEEECLDAAHRTGVGMTLKTDLSVSNHANFPCGCFVYNDSFVNYKDPTHGSCAAQELSKILCREGGKTFEMYSAGEGGGSCESGYEVTQAQCLDAAHATGVGMTLMDDLVVNDMDTTPCGCFVFSKWVNYKDPAHGNCVDQENSKLVCREGGSTVAVIIPESIIYPPGEGGGICESGYELTQAQCLDAAHESIVGMTLKADLIVNDMDTTPCGCFVFNQWVNYKDPAHGNCLAHANGRLVCREGGTTVAVIEPDPVYPIVMYPPGEGGGICENSYEVTEEECLDAAYLTKGGMPLKPDLAVVDGEFLPCGCFVHNDEWVNYKDPAHGNCLAHTRSRLVCREGGTTVAVAPVLSFEMEPAGVGAGEGGGICESGYEVTLGQCLDAAYESGGGMPLTTDLVAHNWPTTPCGCFVFNDWFVNYKDPAHGNCLAHAYSRLVCRKTTSVDDPVYTFEMYSDGEGGGICESGYEVTQKQCLDAAHITGVGMTLLSNLVVSDWNNTPCGCFVHNGLNVNYKDPAHGNCMAHEDSKLVCQVGGTISTQSGAVNVVPSTSTTSSVIAEPEPDLVYRFVMYSGGKGEGICASGEEVTQAQCLDAAHETGVGMALKTYLSVSDWDNLPCGCFIYNDLHVNYKDPAHGNCAAPELSKLVCRTTSSVGLYKMDPAGEARGKCDSGHEVTEEQCLDAAHATGVGMTLKPDLTASDWPITPCGCFVHSDEWVNYKDPAYGNCVAHAQSRLVCIDSGIDFKIYADEEGEGSCPSGKAVAQEECFAAGRESGIGMNLGPEMIVYDWDWTPCGCFIYDNLLVDYKDPVHGNCKPHAKCKSVCRKEVGTQTETANVNPVTIVSDYVSEFEVKAKGSGVSCSSGFEVTVDECYAAAHEAGDPNPNPIGEWTLRKKLSVGDWTSMPCGCFIYRDFYVNYKDPANGNCEANIGSSLVCRKGGVTLSQSTALAQSVVYVYELIAAEEGEGLCVSGKEVTAQECLAAGHYAGANMDLNEKLFIGDWDWTPCGCFIFNDKFVDYKDPAHGNCLAQELSKLVCRKEVETIGIERKL